MSYGLLHDLRWTLNDSSFLVRDCRLQEGLTTEKELGFELTAGQVIKKPSFKWALPYPKIGSIYSYCFWKPEQTWKDWLLIVDNRPPAIDAGYNDIIVPTLDTARYSFLLILLVVHQKHVLFCGPTGTGMFQLELLTLIPRYTGKFKLFFSFI